MRNRHLKVSVFIDLAGVEPTRSVADNADSVGTTVYKLSVLTSGAVG